MSVRLVLASLLPLALLSAAPDTAKPAPRMEDLLPADASVVLLVEDAPSLKGKWEGTPLAKTWADAGVQKFFAPLVRKFEEGFDKANENAESKEGMDLMKGFADLFQGRVALYLSGDLSWIQAYGKKPGQPPPPPKGEMEGDPAKPAVVSEAVEEDEPEHSPHGVLMGEIRDREAWAKLHARGLELSKKLSMAKGVEEREVTEEFQGETLHIQEKIKAGKSRETRAWVVVNGTLIMGSPKTDVQAAVAALKKGASGSPLSASPTFQKARRRCPKTDALLYVNLEPWTALARKAMAEEMGEGNPMGVTGEGLFKALGLDVLQGLYLSATFEPTASEVDAGILYSENRGIVRLLAFQEGAAPRPAFIPEDAVQFSTGRFSLKGLWEGLEGILKEASPMMAAMVLGQVDQFAQGAGVDLRKDLIGNIGEELLSANVLVREAGKPVDLASADQIFAVSLVDAKAFGTALEGIIRAVTRVPAGAEPGPAAEMFETRDYLGTTIHALKAPIPNPQGGEQRLQYAVCDRWLLVSLGKGGVLEAALAAMAKPGKTVWERAEVKAALETLPEGASGLGYSDLSMIVGGWFEQIASLQLMLSVAGDPGMGGDGLCDPAAKPDGKEIGKLWGPCVSAQYRDADGILFRARLLHPRP